MSLYHRIFTCTYVRNFVDFNIFYLIQEHLVFWFHFTLSSFTQIVKSYKWQTVLFIFFINMWHYFLKPISSTLLKIASLWLTLHVFKISAHLNLNPSDHHLTSWAHLHVYLTKNLLQCCHFWHVFLCDSWLNKCVLNYCRDE